MTKEQDILIYIVKANNYMKAITNNDITVTCVAVNSSNEYLCDKCLLQKIKLFPCINSFKQYLKKLSPEDKLEFLIALNGE